MIEPSGDFSPIRRMGAALPPDKRYSRVLFENIKAGLDNLQASTEPIVGSEVFLRIKQLVRGVCDVLLEVAPEGQRLTSEEIDEFHDTVIDIAEHLDAGRSLLAMNTMRDLISKLRELPTEESDTDTDLSGESF